MSLYRSSILVGLFMALVLCSEANAYTLTGFRFDHLRITYSCGNDELAQAVQEWASVSALEDGGCSDTPDITLTIVPNSEIVAPIEGLGGSGSVIIPERNEHWYAILLHETGHALGMGHSSEIFGAPYVLREATMFAWCCNPMNEDDIAGIVALYGRTETYQLRVPMVSAER